jgi:hypothetical protein
MNTENARKCVLPRVYLTPVISADGYPKMAAILLWRHPREMITRAVELARRVEWIGAN